MKIDLYTRCWNDADQLGFFFQHYDPIVQRYVVYDDGSTDGSLDILKAHPSVDLRPMPAYADQDSRVISSRLLQEHCWKESYGAADWVIVTDIDEHLYHPNLLKYLTKMKRQGVTLIPALGFSMIAEAMPAAGSLLSKAITTGAPSRLDSKVNLFCPTAIESIGFGVGRHKIDPVGTLIRPAIDELLLLHYKYIDFNRVMNRHAQYLTRQRKTDLERGWGIQYSWDEQALKNEWASLLAKSIDIRGVDALTWTQAGGERWWLQGSLADIPHCAPWLTRFLNTLR